MSKADANAKPTSEGSKDGDKSTAIDVPQSEKSDLNPEFDPQIQYRDYQLLCTSVTAWTIVYLGLGAAFLAYYTWPRTVAAVNNKKFVEPVCSEPLAMFDLAMGAATFLMAITPLFTWALMRLCKLYRALYALLAVIVLNAGIAAYGTYMVFADKLWSRVHKGQSAEEACDRGLYDKTTYTLFVYWAVTITILVFAIIFMLSYGVPTAIKDAFDMTCLINAIRKSNAAIAAQCKRSTAWCRRKCYTRCCCGEKRPEDEAAEEPLVVGKEDKKA